MLEKTWIAMILAPGATPEPSTPFVPPAAMPATCVPWSHPESAQGAALPTPVEELASPGQTLVLNPLKLLEKHASAMTLLTPPDFRNGCVLSTPVSRMATMVPVPS